MDQKVEPNGIAPASLAGSIGRSRLLAALSAADFGLLAPYLTEKPLEKGAVLQETGVPIEHVYFPHSGLISLLVPVSDGHAVEVAMIGREGAVGMIAGIGSTVALNAAVVQSPGSAVQIAAPRFAKLAQQSGAIQNMVFRYTEALLAQVQQMAACNALHDVQERLSRWLLQARDRTGIDTISITQESLSELLCVRRTTITLVCRRLQSRGVIHIHRGRIEIRDAPALEKDACGCYRVARGAVEAMVRDLGRFAG